MVSKLGDSFTTDPAEMFGVVIVEDVPSFSLFSDMSWTLLVDRESSELSIIVGDVPSFSPSSDRSWALSVDWELSESSESSESSIQELYAVVFNGSSFVVGVMGFGERAVDVPSPMYCRISWVFSLHCDSVK